jgi:hypothetical protein
LIHAAELYVNLKSRSILLLDDNVSDEENAVPALPYVTDIDVGRRMLFVLCACKIMDIFVVEGK